MKKTIITLGIGSIGCILLLVILVNFTDMPNERKNGFSRHWLSTEIIPIHQTAIEAPLEYIAGATPSHYFFTVPNPQWLVMTDHSLHRQDTILFPVGVTDKLASLHSCMIDSPWIYLHANNIPALYYARFDGGRLQTVKLATSLFTKSVQLSPSTMIVRAFDTAHQLQIFQKIDGRTGKVTRQAYIVPQDRKDAGFSTDGTLRYDSLTKRLLFTQFFQNRFYCLDTNLNLQYTGHTIDTTNTNTVSIQQVRIDHEDRLMPSAPRIRVNEQSCVGNGRLYVLSGLIADNENRNAFRENAAIDCYAISDGHYIGSFHIPYIDGEKIKSFYVTSNALIVLYKGSIATFSLNS
jgi:hypothetical protein